MVCVPTWFLAGCAWAVLLPVAMVHGQVSAPATATTAALPAPVYWKQELFLIPYQWSSATEPIGAQAVWLFVSKDQGATWRRISEATPQVKAFNYRAEGDGEYWFAVRTVDRYGRVWPEGNYQPELRVIVDTTMPRILELWGKPLENGAIEIGWRGWDQNLDPSSWRIEVQVAPAGTWQFVPVTSANSADPVSAATATEGDSGRTTWQPPVGSRPVAIRASVLDRAGNSATFQTQMTAVGLLGSMPASPLSTTAPVAQPGEQSWLTAITSRAPFRLSSSGPNTVDDGITAYGMPATKLTSGGNESRAGVDPPITRTSDMGAATNSLSADRWSAPSVVSESTDDSTPASDSRSQTNAAQTLTSNASVNDRLRPADHRPLEPFRQVSLRRLPALDAGTPRHAPREQPKLVGSRTFALEYDLEGTDHRGVARLELWGTRDGGQSWHCYARDDDNRSPVVVTVEEEGLYGFRLVVQGAGDTPAVPPSAGEEPELWVAVDLQRPTVELTAIERGEGNLADHLILRWRAADDNLESRPISLFYSSRPGGPWSAVATNLEDSGAYAWRLERHVPERCYLRIEARDTAGNLAAFQTREPIELTTTTASGRLRGATTVGPTATGSEASFR